jgi:hypothetical protein
LYEEDEFPLGNRSKSDFEPTQLFEDEDDTDLRKAGEITPKKGTTKIKKVIKKEHKSIRSSDDLPTQVYEEEQVPSMTKSQEIRVQDAKIQKVVEMKKHIEEQKKIMSFVRLFAFFKCFFQFKRREKRWIKLQDQKVDGFPLKRKKIKNDFQLELFVTFLGN